MSDSWSYLPGSSGDAYTRMYGSTGDAYSRLPGIIGDAWERLISSGSIASVLKEIIYYTGSAVKSVIFRGTYK